MFCPIIICLCCFVGISFCVDQATIFRGFKWINISFPTPEESKEYIEKEHYRNITMNGIKVDIKGNIYVTFPRWHENVPITLGKLDISTNLFHAFPNWEFNNPLDPSLGLNSVLGFEIDSKQRMWILDQSHVNSLSPAPLNTTKLVIYDLINNVVEHIEYFDNSIAPVSTSFLNDVVVDSLRNIAYISDSGISDAPNYNPALIMYDYNKKESIRFLEKHPSLMPNTSVEFNVDGHKCFEATPMMTGVDGIGLTCDTSNLYFFPLSSRKVYGIQTYLLLNFDEYKDILNTSVVLVGDKGSVSDGMVLGSSGGMYAGSIETNSVIKIREGVLSGYLANRISHDEPIYGQENKFTQTTNLWQDTLCIGPASKLWWSTNDLCNWLQKKLDYNEVNYRIWNSQISEKSYVFGCDEKQKKEKKKTGEIWWYAFPIGGGSLFVLFIFICFCCFVCCCGLLVILALLLGGGGCAGGFCILGKKRESQDEYVSVDFESNVDVT